MARTLPLNNTAAWLTTALLLLLTAAFLRLLYILPSTNPTPPPRRVCYSPTRLLIVLGSGGHTAEMFLLLRRWSIDPRLYTRRSYVISAGDDFSAQRAVEFEESISSMAHAGGTGLDKSYDIYTVPRARRIHQSLLTTPFSALRCCLACAGVLRGTDGPSPEYPDLIICNGPGMAVCIVFVGLALKFFGVRNSTGKMRTIYVESFARVRTLSLSGKILKWACDRFIVQWKGLKEGRAEYLGVLV